MRNLNTITTRVGIPVFQHREDVNQYVYARFGIQLPHPSGMQATVGH